MSHSHGEHYEENATRVPLRVGEGQLLLSLGMLEDGSGNVHLQQNT